MNRITVFATALFLALVPLAFGGLDQSWRLPLP